MGDIKYGFLFLLVIISMNSTSSICDVDNSIPRGIYITGVWPTIDPNRIGFSYNDFYNTDIGGKLIFDLSEVRVDAVEEDREPQVIVKGILQQVLYTSTVANDTWYLAHYNRSLILSMPITTIIASLNISINNSDVYMRLTSDLEQAKLLVSDKLDLLFISIHLNATYTLVRFSLSDNSIVGIEQNSSMAKLIFLQRYLKFYLFDEQSIIITGSYPSCQDSGSYLKPTFYLFNESFVGKLFSTFGPYYVRGDTDQIVFLDSQKEYGNIIGIIDLNLLKMNRYNISSAILGEGNSNNIGQTEINSSFISIGVVGLITAVYLAKKPKLFRK